MTAIAPTQMPLHGNPGIVPPWLTPKIYDPVNPIVPPDPDTPTIMAPAVYDPGKPILPGPGYPIVIMHQQ